MSRSYNCRQIQSSFPFSADHFSYNSVISSHILSFCFHTSPSVPLLLAEVLLNISQSTDYVKMWIYLWLWYKLPPKGQIVPNPQFPWVVRFNLNSSVHLYIWHSKIVFTWSWITRKSTKASWKCIFDPQLSDCIEILKIILEIQRDIFIHIKSSSFYVKSWHRKGKEQAEPQLTPEFVYVCMSFIQV